MAETKSTAITIKAYDIAQKINESRKEKGLASSVASVISEAVVEHFGKMSQEN
jgi:hypothetical protein